MELTSTAWVMTTAVLTAAAFVAVLVGWGRLAGPGILRVTGRALSLLLVNLLVLLIAATALNAQFLFFASWQDLVGAFGSAQHVAAVSRGGAASTAADRAVPGQAAVAARSLPPLPPGANLSQPIAFTVTGPRSGVTGEILVRLPPGYTDPARSTVRYPVLEAFGGYPGSPRSWFGGMNLAGALDSQVAARHLRAALVVAPQWEVPAGTDTECVDGHPGDPQVETWLTRDVPDWVARTFRVGTDRSSWATIGLSAGGWCAAMAAMLHPAQYSAAVVLGGYFRPEFGPFYQPYPVGSAAGARYDLVRPARRSPPPVAIWLETSHVDPVSYSSTAAFLRATRSPTAVDAVVLQHAGHRLSVWQGLLPQSLTWLGANVSGFAAPA